MGALWFNRNMWQHYNPSKPTNFYEILNFVDNTLGLVDRPERAKTAKFHIHVLRESKRRNYGIQRIRNIAFNGHQDVEIWWYANPLRTENYWDKATEKFRSRLVPATSEFPRNLVLDFDKTNFNSIDDFLKAFKEQGTLLPLFVTQTSPRSFHALYQNPIGWSEINVNRLLAHIAGVEFEDQQIDCSLSEFLKRSESGAVRDRLDGLGLDIGYQVQNLWKCKLRVPGSLNAKVTSEDFVCVGWGNQNYVADALVSQRCPSTNRITLPIRTDNKEPNPEKTNPNNKLQRKKYRLRFTKQIERVLWDKRVATCKGLVSRNRQAKYLSKHLGYLLAGTHAIAVDSLSSFLGVSVKTGSKIRTIWESKGLIVSVKEHMPKVTATTYKAGAVLESVCSTSKPTLDHTISELSALFPLETGITYTNGIHWYRQLTNSHGMTDAAIELILVENDLSTSSDDKQVKWRERVQRFAKTFQA